MLHHAPQRLRDDNKVFVVLRKQRSLGSDVVFFRDPEFEMPVTAGSGPPPGLRSRRPEVRELWHRASVAARNITDIQRDITKGVFAAAAALCSRRRSGWPADAGFSSTEGPSAVCGATLTRPGQGQEEEVAQQQDRQHAPARQVRRITPDGRLPHFSWNRQNVRWRGGRCCCCCSPARAPRATTQVSTESRAHHRLCVA